MNGEVFHCVIFSIFNPFFSLATDRDSSAGIATRYDLDGPGIESR